MFTSLTLSAISVLHAINSAEKSKPDWLSLLETCALLDCLTSGGFICLIPGKPGDDFTSYCLARPLEDISLLSLLDALGDNLKSVHYIDSGFYAHYGLAARKLGVVNQVTRTYLSEINVSDISLP